MCFNSFLKEEKKCKHPFVKRHSLFWIKHVILVPHGLVQLEANTQVMGMREYGRR